MSLPLSILLVYYKQTYHIHNFVSFSSVLANKFSEGGGALFFQTFLRKTAILNKMPGLIISRGFALIDLQNKTSLWQSWTEMPGHGGVQT